MLLNLIKKLRKPKLNALAFENTFNESTIFDLEKDEELLSKPFGTIEFYETLLYKTIDSDDLEYLNKNIQFYFIGVPKSVSDTVMFSELKSLDVYKELTYWEYLKFFWYNLPISLMKGIDYLSTFQMLKADTRDVHFNAFTFEPSDVTIEKLSDLQSENPRVSDPYKKVNYLKSLLTVFILDLKGGKHRYLNLSGIDENDLLVGVERLDRLNDEIESKNSVGKLGSNMSKVHGLITYSPVYEIVQDSDIEYWQGVFKDVESKSIVNPTAHHGVMASDSDYDVYVHLSIKDGISLIHKLSSGDE